MIETFYKNLTILIVDDSESSLALLSACLKDYHVLCLSDSSQAIALAKQEQPDLIILDIKMPGIDGYEICRQLKQQDDTSNIPIIFVTGLDDEVNEIDGLSVGANDYITKPIRPAVVRARVALQLQLKSSRDQLAKQANTDGLTGVSNRRHFETIVTNEWNRAVRYGNTLNLLMIDIDYFKLFNDHYGHSTGDSCLKSVAQCLKDLSRRANELVARLGGEEFVCLLAQMPKEQAVERAEQILSAVRVMNIPHIASNCSNIVTVSMGLASCCPTGYESWQNLLEKADQALYKAKRAGRNQLIVA